jgi:hypothetical protein
MATLTPDLGFEHTQLLVNGQNVSSSSPVKNGDWLRVLVCAPMETGFNETFSLRYGGTVDTVTVVTEHAPPSPPPPDVRADSFVFTNASITVKPGVCSMIPSSDSVMVSGLGNGVMVEATLSPDVGFNRSELIVNNASVSSPTTVRNGDSLRVLVCAPTVYGASETFTLMYGGQTNMISVHTTGIVSGVATIEGYSVDSFGDNETASFA